MKIRYDLQQLPAAAYIYIRDLKKIYMYMNLFSAYTPI